MAEEQAGIIEFLRTALDAQNKKKSDANYNYVVTQMNIKGDSVLLIKLLVGLSNCVNKLSENPDSYASLMRGIWHLEVGGDVPLGTALSQFLQNLVSANNCFLLQSLDLLIKQLVPPNDISDEDLLIRENGNITWVHTAIKNLFWVAPVTAITIVNVISEHFPHKRMPINKVKGYFLQILKICTYASAVRDRILKIIVDRLIEIDVEIKIEDGYAIISHEECMDMFDMEDGPLDGTNGKNDVTVDEMAEKLDNCMDYLFDYIDQECSKSQENCDSLFHTLLDIFESSILLTHRSKYTQFILFFVARKGRKYVDAFVGRLINKVLSNEIAMITRVSSLAYVASFLGRATYIMSSTLKSAIYYLMEWVKVFNKNYNSSIESHELSLPIYYAVVQSIAYIMCFKGERLASTADGLLFIKQYDWDSLIFSCELDPLMYCLSTVRSEFINITKKLEICELSNKSKYLNEDIDFDIDSHLPPKHSKRKDSGAGGLGSGDNPLDSFFPFDPYLLRKSSRYINNIYLRFTSNASEIDDEEWNDEGKRIDEPSPVLASLVSSLTGMSLTPISHSVDDFHQIVFGSRGSNDSGEDEHMAKNLSKFSSERHNNDDGSW